MKKFLKPLLLSLGGAFLMGTFCCNADAMKIEVPLPNLDPSIGGGVLTCDNCDSIAVKITQDNEYSYLFRAHFQDSQHPENNLRCIHIGQDFIYNEDEYNYWRPHCNKEIIIPINNISNDVLKNFISIASYTNTSFLMDDFLKKQQGVLSWEDKQYLDEKDTNCCSEEFSIFENSISNYLKSYLQQLDDNQQVKII